MTPAQLQTLKAAILADPALVPLTSGVNTDYSAIANAMNLEASPAFRVWKMSITRRECQTDGFDWTQADNLSAGQARIWDWLFDGSDQTMNPSEPGKRAGISECWKGTGAKAAVATFVLGRCKRNALRVEKVLATGTGSEGSPATIGYEGELSINDVALMFNV